MKRTELKSMLEARFDKLDANHDGKLSPEDRDLARTERRDVLFSKLDSNKDGSISKAEFSSARRDGQPGRSGQQQADDDKGDARFSHANWRPRPMHGMMPGGAQEPISKADFVAKGLARFDKVDTDHDGIISPAERDAARTQMRDDRGRNQKPSAPAPPQG
jgi:Ca2+-binding EF-hand superfamily protein